MKGTPRWFAKALLRKLGYPVTASNVDFIVGWEAREGGHWHNSATFNPLNTTQAMPGYSKTGVQGNIGAYTSWRQGIAATVKTLRNGLYNDILAALRSGDASTSASYSGLGKWSGGGYTSLGTGGSSYNPPAPTKGTGAGTAATGGAGAGSSDGGSGSILDLLLGVPDTKKAGLAGALDTLNPASWFQKETMKAVRAAAGVSIALAFIGGGVVVVIIGLQQTVKPTIQKVQTQAVDVAGMIATDGASAGLGGAGGAAAKGATA